MRLSRVVPIPLYMLFAAVATTAKADPLENLSISVTELFAKAETARAYGRLCAEDEAADSVRLRDASASWSHRNDAKSYDALIAALTEAAPGLGEQVDAAMVQIDERAARAVESDPQICHRLPERLASDEFDIRPILRQTRRMALDLGVRPAEEQVPPPMPATEIFPLAQFSAWASAIMDEIGSKAGARQDRDLREAREEYLLARLQAQEIILFHGRIQSDSELREWRGDEQSTFSVSCSRFVDQIEQEEMAARIGEDAVLAGMARWVYDNPSGGVVSLRNCRIFTLAEAGLPLTRLKTVDLEPRPPMLEEVRAAPGEGIALSAVDRVLYEAEFTPRMDGFGNGYLNRQEDVYVLLRDGTAWRHEWPLPVTDLDLEVSRAREAGRWFTWSESGGAVILTRSGGPDAGATLELISAQRLAPMEEGQTLAGTWSFTDIGMAGLRRDRSYSFSHDGTVVHERDSFVGGNVATSFITSPLGDAEEIRSTYRFEPYALVLDGPEGEERYFLARLKDSDPDAPEDLIIGGRIYWADEED